MENRLSENKGHNKYLLNNQLSEADIRLFVTLIRFDTAYHGLFKCNKKRIHDYPALNSYMKKLYSLDAFKNSVNFTHIKQGYYSIKALNPNGIVPAGPDLLLRGSKLELTRTQEAQ
ncbi:MAG: putative glutathione S-transferase [Flavobacteriales bacterium]|jgi:putative glutathione S-transferase